MQYCAKANTPKSKLEYPFRGVEYSRNLLLSCQIIICCSELDSWNSLSSGWYFKFCHPDFPATEIRCGAPPILVEIVYKITACLIHQSDMFA
jgi:hypothetical protein